MSEDNGSNNLGKVERTSISYNLFEGWIVTALEGGSNYWCDIPKDSIPDAIQKKYKEETLSFSELVAKAVWDDKQSINVVDYVNGESIGQLSLPSVKKALEKICENHLETFTALLEETYDADDADVFLQYAVLGEITFG